MLLVILLQVLFTFLYVLFCKLLLAQSKQYPPAHPLASLFGCTDAMALYFEKLQVHADMNNIFHGRAYYNVHVVCKAPARGHSILSLS